jgi:hypothetical protein
MLSISEVREGNTRILMMNVVQNFDIAGSRICGAAVARRP